MNMLIKEKLESFIGIREQLRKQIENLKDIITHKEIRLLRVEKMIKDLEEVEKIK